MQFFDSNGDPLSGGKVYTYAAGTSTPLATYTDQGGATPNANPVILDSRGEAAIWFGGSSYKLVLKTSADVLIWTADNVTAALAALAASSGSSLVGFLQAGTGAIAESVQAALRRFVAVEQFGFTTTNTAAANGALVATLITLAEGGVPLLFQSGVYQTNTPFLFTREVTLTGIPGASAATIIKLTSAANYVMSFDASVLGSIKGPVVRGITLDGNGVAVDGLLLKGDGSGNGIIFGEFSNIVAYNVTAAALHLQWAQQCVFNSFICSSGFGAFSTTPVNGIKVDTYTSSANTFIAPSVRGVSGAAFKATTMINSTIIAPNLEVSDYGIDWGHATTGAVTNNTVIQGDIESNTTSDIRLLATAKYNKFLNVTCDTTSKDLLLTDAQGNSFDGGISHGVTVSGVASQNSFRDYNITEAGRTITSAAARYTIIDNVTQISDGYLFGDTGVRRTNYYTGAGPVAVDAALGAYIFATATAATLVIAVPTHPADGMLLDVTIANASGGALTVTWTATAGGFKIAGWTNPATGFNRSVTFRYNATAGFWYAIAISQTDVAN